MKKGIVIAGLSAVFVTILLLFWYNAWVYSLPTPVPQNYHAVAVGNYVQLKEQPDTHLNKPLFIHFFNPDCPCSRFNIAHFKTLVKEHSDKVNFEVVVLTSKDYTAKDIQHRFELDVPIVFDSSVAAACGVYSTPQAAIIDTDHKLYYRGNYNKSRYCTDTNSNYAQIALEGLLNNNHNTIFSRFATKAYGCSLPGCNN